MPGGLDIGKAPANKVVLPFYGTGAIAFLALVTMLFLNTFPLMGGYFEPHLLAITHTAVLAWGTMVIFGASYQLLPVICEKDLYHEGVAAISYYFLLTGSVCLIVCFWLFLTGAWMITGGSLVFIAGLLYFFNVLKTIGKRTRYNIQKLFILFSAVWLMLTMLIGVLLAINLKYPFIYSRSHLEILKLHAHAGLAGWFLQLIVGVSGKLIPMFLLGRSKKENLLKIAFVFQNAGLALFLIDGYLFGVSYRYLIYAAMVLSGIVLWISYLIDVYRHRIKRPLDYSMKHTFLSFISLGVSLALIPVVYFANDARWTIIYGLFLLVGWISAIIIGMTFKTLPFIVWNSKYKMVNGKAKIPLPKELYWGSLLKWQFWLFLSALYITGLSLAFQAYLPLRIGLGLLLLAGIIYVVNTFKVLTHQQVKFKEGNGI